jgi:hypothetical protein
MCCLFDYPSKLDLARKSFLSEMGGATARKFGLAFVNGGGAAKRGLVHSHHMVRA